MSDSSEELKRPTTEDDLRGVHVLSGSGMYFPWLQKHVETVVTGGKKEKDFAQTTSACLSFIQEALLKHQWQQAAEYMHSYFQILEDSDSNKRQGAPEISLQHALYLLHHGMLEDANRNLSQAETWRYGEKSSSQEVLINLIQAYKGLLQYYTWSQKKMELSKLDKDDYVYNTASQNMLNHSWKTSVNLCALIQIPGVWDPFVKSYVEMLEFYGDRDGAREVLSNYAYDEKFPSNPNAHVYLYNFLKKEKAPREKLISVLKILYQIVPSHKLMLEFHRLLKKSEKEEHRKLGLEVLFGILDFAGCTKNITAWKYLAKYLRQTLMGNNVAWVQEEWSSRKNWWPGFHFSYFWAKSDWKEDEALACEKALVAGLLLGKETSKVSELCNGYVKASCELHPAFNLCVTRPSAMDLKAPCTFGDMHSAWFHPCTAASNSNFWLIQLSGPSVLCLHSCSILRSWEIILRQRRSWTIVELHEFHFFCNPSLLFPVVHCLKTVVSDII